MIFVRVSQVKNTSTAAVKYSVDKQETQMATGNSELPKLHPIVGFKLGTTSAGIKTVGRPDLVIMEVSENSSVAALFTKNVFCAAPVTVCKQRLLRCQPRYLVTNSGNANAGTGEQGLLDATLTCSNLAALAGVDIDTILPFSFTSLSKFLPTPKIATSGGFIIGVK